MTCKNGAKEVQNQSIFLTEKEKSVVEFLKDSPKVYSEIVKNLQGKHGIKDRRTVNKLLRVLEDKRVIFRVEVDGKVFYKLNIFPFKAQIIFELAERSKMPELLELKDIILKKYPAISLEKIIKKYREYLRIAVPNAKKRGLIKFLKDLEKHKIEPLKP